MTDPAAQTLTRPRIFVSYRRQDSEAVVGRLVEDLRRAFPEHQVFQDWASIAPGEDFVVALERELATCAVALVAIGPRWLSAADAGGKRRLDDPDDWVRREITACLEREDVRVFPLLLEGAGEPAAAELPEAIRGLARRQAYPIVTRHWAKDVGALVDILRQLPELQSDHAPAGGPVSGGDGESSPARKRWALAAGLALALVIGLVISNSGGDRPDERRGSAPSAPAGEATAEVPTAPEPKPEPSAVPMAIAPAAAPGTTFRDCADCPEMVVVPTGDVLMGSPEDEQGRDPDEGPQHRVHIGQAFAVGETEITFEQWDACVAGGGCSHKPADNGWGRGRQPVLNVGWNDAQEYVQWLAGKTGQRYRLLSEAEWEYAARAGSTTRYPWGDAPGNGKANFRGSGSEWSGKQTAPVGSLAANAFGLHDMIGNVWEWVEDCGHDDYRDAPTDGRPWETAACVQRVVRGGSWDDGSGVARSAVRDGIGHGFRNSILGFRLARTL